MCIGKAQKQGEMHRRSKQTHKVVTPLEPWRAFVNSAHAQGYFEHLGRDLRTTAEPRPTFPFRLTQVRTRWGMCRG